MSDEDEQSAEIRQPAAAPQAQARAAPRATSATAPAAAPLIAPPNNQSIWYFESVFAAEYKDIHSRDSRIPGGAPKHQVPTVSNGLTGLALSGGGIRSASFSLGVLQAINAAGLLKDIHYLSTVSGGGYIGTAMTVAMSTNGGAFPYGKTGHDFGETPETRHLRDNSRYLLQQGAKSAVSAMAIYLRGIVMNVIVALPFLFAAAALLVLAKPDTYRLVTAWSFLSRFPEALTQTQFPLTLLGALAVGALLVVYAIGVSVFPIQPLGVRRAIAFFAAIVLGIFGLIAFFEIHLFVLRFAFGIEGAITAPAANSTPPPVAQIPDTLFKSLKTFITWATPFVLGLLPFIKSLSEKAVSGEAGGLTDALGRWTSRVVLLLLAAIVPLVLWLTMVQLAYWGIGVSKCSSSTAILKCAGDLVDTWQHDPTWFASILTHTDPVASATVGRTVGWWYLGAAAVLLLVWPFLNVNANSLHQLYRDRLGSAFLVQRKPGTEELEAADNFRLQQIDPALTPYHLINTALNVPGSSFANKRGRNADFFLFSHRFVGSEATGYVPTVMAEEVTDGLNIGTAMAISGAAAAPNMGTASLRPLSPTIAFLNVRLGRWMRHPIGIYRVFRTRAKLTWLLRLMWWKGKPWPRYVLKEAFFKSGDNVRNLTKGGRLASGFVFLTDGGHIENLGIYELLRRRCAVIIAVDGEADSDFTAGSLVQLQRFARIDLGTVISMDWKPIAERSRLVSENAKKNISSIQNGPHVALGLIDYPPAPGRTKREAGVLVYIKASLSGDENDYVMAYKAAHPSFPHETTLEQLFSEEQLECYRALGEHIARRFIDGSDAASADPLQRTALLTLLKARFASISAV